MALVGNCLLVILTDVKVRGVIMASGDVDTLIPDRHLFPGLHDANWPW